MLGRIVLLGAVLCLARVAYAESGIEEASQRDAAASRGIFLPGGLTAPGGSVSLEIETVPLPVAGAAALRVSPHDRVELFSAAEWTAMPGYGTFDTEQLGVRAQVYRGELVRIAIGALGGRRYRSPATPRFDDKITAGLAGASAGLSACLDGTDCEWVGDANISWAREVGSHSPYRDELGDGRMGAMTVGASTSSSTVRRLRYVGSLATYVRRYISGMSMPGDVAAYGGVRWADSDISFDAGLIAMTQAPYSLPVISISYRLR
jgi:hypothetical protein